MKDRLPTEFETKVLRRIEKYGDLYGGDKMIHWANAAKRLMWLGYLGKGKIWYLTDKGRLYLTREYHP